MKPAPPVTGGAGNTRSPKRWLRPGASKRCLTRRQEAYRTAPLPSSRATAHEVVAALGGSWHGSYGVARCPAHDDRTPSLSVRDGGDNDVVVKCHAGCDWRDVKAALRDRGLLPERENRERHRPRRRRHAPNEQAALEIWRTSRPAPGTPVETYLRHRGITVTVPPTLRYHPGVRYESSGLHLPCMVAAVQAPDRRITAIHRTYLRGDGKGKAGVSTPKMALGPIGDGAVRLGPAEPALGLAEGIETALSAMQLFEITVWAALGSRMDRVAVPDSVLEIQLFGDNGGPGREAAEKAAGVFTDQGRRVALRFPPSRFGDWNDALGNQETETVP